MRIWIVSLLLLSAGPAAAETPTGGAPRYVFVPVERGALRLDTGTGAVSLCSGAEGAGACEPVREEAGRIDAELAALRAEVAGLQTRITALEARPEALGDAESLDRVMVLADRMMRRFIGMVRDIKADMERGEF